MLSLGTRLAEALKAADTLSEQGVAVTVADARFAKPLDEALILDLAREPRGPDHDRGGLAGRVRRDGAASPRRSGARWMRAGSGCGR